MNTTNVMILGDSFAANETFLSQLYSKIGDDQHMIQFQGSQIAGLAYHHEGYPGITAPGLDIKMPTILTENPAVDIFVLIVGKNDVFIGFSVDTTLQYIRSMIAKINQARPTAKIVLPYLTPFALPVENDAVIAINRGLREVRLLSNVYPVFTYGGMNYLKGITQADLDGDGVHLTPTGWGKLAGLVAETIRPIRL